MRDIAEYIASGLLAACAVSAAWVIYVVVGSWIYDLTHKRRRS